MRGTQGMAAGLALALILSIGLSPALSQEQPYTVGPGDVLDVAVLGEPEVSGTLVVNPDGNLMVPMVGEVSVTGLNVEQITAKLTTEFRKLIKEPRVKVSVRETAINRQLVYVLGQVIKPGVYSMQRGWTVADLLATAGGPVPQAAATQAMIMRKSTTITVDLQKLLVDGNAEANVALEAGDVVIVPETKNRVALMGEVIKPGPYQFRPGDHVIDALSAAGGLTLRAVPAEIGIIRKDGGKTTVTHVDLSKFYKDGDSAQNVALQPGDVVYVPAKHGADWYQLANELPIISWFAGLFH